jgi:mannitol/fructose-specific phosphotransferase system IIA component
MGLTEIPHGMDKSSFDVTWHGIDLTQVPHGMRLGLTYVPCGMSYLNLT